MGRRSYTQYVTIPNGTALSGIISFYKYVSGIVHLPAAWTAADIGFQVASELDGTFQPLYDATGTLVEIGSPDADGAYAFPEEVQGALFIKIWSETGGGDTNQGAARDLIVDVKS